MTSTWLVVDIVMVDVTTFVERGCFVTVLVVLVVIRVVVVLVSRFGFAMHSHADLSTSLPYFSSQ